MVAASPDQVPEFLSSSQAGVFRRLTIFFAAFAIVISITGIIGYFLGQLYLSSFIEGYKTIALTAALSWIFLGVVLILNALKPVDEKRRTISLVILGIIILYSFLSLIGTIFGISFVIEGIIASNFARVTNTFPSLMSPIAALLIFISSICLVLLLVVNQQKNPGRHMLISAGVLAGTVVMVSFTFFLSYFFGTPLLYGTQIIPISATSALAGLSIGSGLVTSAGPDRYPVRLFIGKSILPRLLRTFIPLIVVVILIQSFFMYWFSGRTLQNNVFTIAISIVLFSVITGFIVWRIALYISSDLERTEHEKDIAHETLIINEELLRETNEYLNNLINYASAPIITWDPEFRITRFNHAFEHLAGRSEKDVLGKNLDILFPVDSKEASLSRIKNTLEGERWESVEIPILHTNGTVSSVLWNSANVLDHDGKIIATIAQGVNITDRKKAEEALRETNEYLDNLINYANAPIITWDPEFRITRFNHAFEHLAGRSEKDVLGKYLDILFPADSREASLSLIKNTLEGEQWESVEIPILHTNGTVSSVLWNSANVLDHDGKIIATIAQGVDITDRKKVEEALRETNEYLNNLINYASAPIITWDPEFRITRFNHAFEHLAGRSEKDVLGKYLDILFPADSRGASLSRIKNTLEGEQWESVEIPILHTNGTVSSVLWNSANVLDHDGKIFAIIAQGVDITEQKKALDRIRWLASFPELNPNPVVEMNGRGEITFANAITKKTLLNLGLPDDPSLFLPDDKDELLRILHETENLQAYREVTLAGETFAETISLNHILQVVRIYILNITEKKRYQDEREQLISDLEQKNAELERFAYTASHDLKTPLITIRGFLGFIAREAETGDMDTLRNDLARVGKAVGKMQELLDSLLELSRIGRVVGPLVPVSMKKLVMEAVELLSVPINERKVTITIAQDLPEVYGDKQRLLEVMVNLIENGVKFMGNQPSPLIEIGVHYDLEGPVFFVRDNGIGIPKEYQGRLFTLFERLEVNAPGSGVGLAMVKRIIEIHGGKIWLESEGTGKGTTFWFTLPGIPEQREVT
jgi:PAS domain S-box-containing protein